MKWGNMRKHDAVMFLFVFTLITVWGMLLPAYGQEKVKQGGASKEAAAFTIKRLVVGTGVDKGEPVGVSETFPAPTEKVYCFLEATDIAKDAEVSFVWVYGQKEMLKTTLSLKMGLRWRTYANKNLMGLKGEWSVQIKGLDGKVLKDVKFKVE